MKRVGLFLLLAGVAMGPAARAQDFNHVEVGAFGEYFRMGDTGSNFGGLGGRAAVNVWRFVQVEAEMSYDFNRVFTEGFRNSSGGTVTAVNSNIKVLHGLAGFKLQNSGPVRFFVTAKGGADNFRFDPVPASFSQFTSSVNNLRTNDVDAVFYPGGGVEAFLGPIGLRAEVGDEMVFVNGVHHNLKVSFGPQFRF